MKFKIETKPPIVLMHPFYIVTTINEGMVLGFDFLSKHKLALFANKRALGYLMQEGFKILTLNTLEAKSIVIDKEPIKINVPDEYRHIVVKWLTEMPNIYATKLSDIGTAKGYLCRIKTTGSPVKHKARKVPYAYLPQVKAQIDEMLKCGIISRSTSHFSSPIVTTPKKDGSIRVCLDARSINKQILVPSWPLPNMQRIIDSLEGAKWFVLLDLFSGFNQILVHPKDRHKLCMVTPFGAYEYSRLPFGISCAPAYFQKVIQEIFEPLLFKGIIQYLDDITIYGKTVEELTTRTEIALRILQDSGLKIKLSKCHFFLNTIEFLGFKISEKGIEPSEKKIAPIRDYPRPRTARQVQAFTAFCNYYRRWVYKFAEIARPLYKLTNKDVKFKWGLEEENAFIELKKRLTCNPILFLPIWSRQFFIMVDSSGFACSAILTQFHPPQSSTTNKNNNNNDKENTKESPDDIEVPIAFASKNYTDAQRKYGATVLELYAIVFGVETYREYICGRKFYVVSDCRALKHVMDKKQTKSRMIERWVQKLSEYQMEILYRPAKEGINTDVLSRIELPVNSVCFVSYEVDDWVQAQQEDSYCRKILNEMTEPKSKKAADYREKYKLLAQGLLSTIDGRVVCPENKKKEVLKMAHEHKAGGGHLGIQKTLDKVQRRYSWQYLAVDVINFVNNCMNCNKRKALGYGKAPLKSMPVTSEVMKMMCSDIIGPLAETRSGHKFILNVMDYATRYVISIPLIDQTAATVASKLVNQVFTIFGAPGILLSDQGTNYTSELMKNVCVLFGIDKIRSSAFHSIGDGLIEKYNSTCNSMIASYCHANPDKWDLYLNYVTLAYNVSKNASTKFSPFELFYGREPVLPTDLGPSIRYRSVENQQEIISQHWHIALEIAKENLLSAQHVQKKYYDRGSKLSEFSVNEKILLKEPPLGRTKYSLRFDGPYTVLRQTGESNYQIKNDKTGKLFLVHTNRMKKLRGDASIMEQRNQASKEEIEKENKEEKERELAQQEGNNKKKTDTQVTKRGRGRPPKKSQANSENIVNNDGQSASSNEDLKSELSPNKLKKYRFPTPPPNKIEENNLQVIDNQKRPRGRPKKLNSKNGQPNRGNNYNGQRVTNSGFMVESNGRRRTRRIRPVPGTQADSGRENDKATNNKRKDNARSMKPLLSSDVLSSNDESIIEYPIRSSQRAKDIKMQLENTSETMNSQFKNSNELPISVDTEKTKMEEVQINDNHQELKSEIPVKRKRGRPRRAEQTNVISSSYNNHSDNNNNRYSLRQKPRPARW